MAIKYVLNFLIISVLFISFSEGLEFSLEFPEKVFTGEEFLVKLKTNQEISESYDVKIFVHKHTKEFSEIFYNNEWKSPFNYLISVFPSIKEFKIKSHFLGETSICARLRKSEEKGQYFEVCKPITVKMKENINNNENKEIENFKESEEKKENKVEFNKSNNLINEKSNNLKNSVISQKENKIIKTENKSKIIKLNDNKIQEKKESLIITKQEKIRLWIIYSFTFLCVIIIILLSLKKL